ncbi:MAG: hypothetical protein KC657_17545 [Myxococcales bacterium]|nr:hypothetical protein [Myxococcales bacterium]
MHSKRTFACALAAVVLGACTSSTTDAGPGTASSSSGSSGVGAAKSELWLLAEEWPAATSAQIKARLDKLTVHDHFVLEYVGKQLKAGVFRRACEVAPDIRWSWQSDGARYDCPKANKEWNDYVAWVASNNLGDPNANITKGVDDILIYFKCKAGEIDQASCDLYKSVNGQIDEGVGRTSEVVVDNLGNQCRVGKDPGCYL